MLEPYKLVVGSSLLFLIFLLSIFFIRKRRNFHFIFLILASLLPLFSLLRRGVHQSSDFAIHIERAIDLYNSLSYGIFPVHWASLLNATYGYPLFLFIYPLPYYSIAVFKILGLSFIASGKIVIAFTFILSGAGIYLLLRNFLKPLHSLTGAILYLFAPYHLVDMHFRAALGELFAFAFLPFVFHFICRFVKNGRLIHLFLLYVSFAALILSHQAILLICAPFIFIYLFFTKTTLNKSLAIFITLLFSLLSTSFYWLSLLTHLQFTYQSVFTKTIAFEKIELYFTSPWLFSFLYQGPTGQLSFPMGFIQIALLFFILFLLAKNKVKKKFKKPIILLLFSFLLLFLLLFPITELLWKTLPFMTGFQFVYRLMLPISFILALTGALAAVHIKSQKIIFILIFLAMATTILNWGTRATIQDIDDSYLIQHAPLSTFEGEGLQAAAPIWRDGGKLWEKNSPTAPIETISGSTLVKKIERTPISHSYEIEVSKSARIRENTFYFPGWNLYVNDKKHPFTYQDEKETNIITFNLPEGTHKVLLRYETTSMVRLANQMSILSIAGFFLFLGYLIFQRLK